MLERASNFALIFKIALICFALLISCKISALPASPSNFKEAMAAVEKSKNKDPSQALILLNSYQLDLTQLKVEQLIQYYQLLAEIHAEQDLYLKCKIFADKGLTLSKELSSPSIVIAELLYIKGYAHENLGEMTEAEHNYENGLELAKSFNDIKIISEGLINLGAIYYQTDRFESSLKVFNEAYTLISQTNYEELKGTINGELSILYSYLSQNKKSIVYARKAHQHYLNAGKSFYALNVLSAIAAKLAGKEEYEEAIKLYQEVLDEAKDINNGSMLYGIYSGLSWSMLKQKESNPEAAIEYILLAGQHIKDSEHHEAKLYYFFDKAEIFKEAERYEEALTAFYQADSLLPRPIQPQHKWYFVYTLLLKSEIVAGLNHHKEAYELTSKLIATVKSLRQEENLIAVDDLRLQFESEQSDMLKIILEQKKQLNSLEQSEADRESSQQRNYLIVSALLALSLAWLIIKLVYGQKSLLKASRTDSLTGMLNRRYTMQLAARLFNKAIEENSSLCVFMIDVDHFKKINDSFGHKIGDQVLTQISEISNNTMRETDVFGRFGGEEFVAFLPNTTLKQGHDIADRLRLVINQYFWSNKKVDKISISIGISALEIDQQINTEHTLESLLKKADLKLFQAKDQGRNKVCS